MVQPKAKAKQFGRLRIDSATEKGNPCGAPKGEIGIPKIAVNSVSGRASRSGPRKECAQTTAAERRVILCRALFSLV
jgi:hypothetical protein